MLWARVPLWRRPKKRGPFQRVPVIARATSDRDRKVCPFQAKPFACDRHPVQHAFMLAHQQGSGFEAARLLDGRDDLADLVSPGFRLGGLTRDLLEHSNRLPIEIAKGIGLELVGENAQQEVLGEVARRRAAEDAPPAHLQVVSSSSRRCLSSCAIRWRSASAEV